MDAKEAAKISKVAMTAAAKGIMRDDALKRIHGAITVTAKRSQDHVRLNCDQMTRGVRSAVSRVLKKEGYKLNTAADPGVKGRIWFEIEW